MQLLSVNYHYIREEKYKSGIYPMSLMEFEKQLDDLGKNYIFISQSDLIEKMHNNLFENKNYCLITFDDGLKEQMDAVDLMSKKGIPGVFYVTTDAIEKAEVVDVHKLHYIRSILDDKDLYAELDKKFSISQYNFDMNILQKQYRYDDELSQKVKYFINFSLTKELRKGFIDTIFIELVSNVRQFSRNLYMSIEDVLKLEKLDILGTHSASHRPLATLSGEDIITDIQESIEFFNKIGINKIKSISYPYGSPAAVDEKTVRVAEQFDFSFGMTMYRGVNSLNELKNDPMLIKRVSCSDINQGKLVL